MKKNLLLIAFGVVCSLLFAGIVFLASQPPRGNPIQLSPPPTPKLWVVQVSGAVAYPGVYELPAGSRVRDAVLVAGGVTSGVNLSRINQAALLEDGQCITIPFTTPETGLFPNRENSPFTTTETPSSDSAQSSLVLPALLNLNTATLEELEQLPEVGQVLAQRIIDYRSTEGSFATIEDIMKVTGIGWAKFDQIKDFITVEP